MVTLNCDTALWLGRSCPYLAPCEAPFPFNHSLARNTGAFDFSSNDFTSARVCRSSQLAHSSSHSWTTSLLETCAVKARSPPAVNVYGASSVIRTVKRMFDSFFKRCFKPKRTFRAARSTGLRSCATQMSLPPRFKSAALSNVTAKSRVKWSPKFCKYHSLKCVFHVHVRALVHHATRTNQVMTCHENVCFTKWKIKVVELAGRKTSNKFIEGDIQEDQYQKIILLPMTMVLLPPVRHQVPPPRLIYLQKVFVCVLVKNIIWSFSKYRMIKFFGKFL